MAAVNVEKNDLCSAYIKKKKTDTAIRRMFFDCVWMIGWSVKITDRSEYACPDDDMYTN